MSCDAQVSSFIGPVQESWQEGHCIGEEACCQKQGREGQIIGACLRSVILITYVGRLEGRIQEEASRRVGHDPVDDYQQRKHQREPAEAMDKR